MAQFSGRGKRDDGNNPDLASALFAWREPHRDYLVFPPPRPLTADGIRHFHRKLGMGSELLMPPDQPDYVETLEEAQKRHIALLKVTCCRYSRLLAEHGFADREGWFAVHLYFAEDPFVPPAKERSFRKIEGLIADCYVRRQLDQSANLRLRLVELWSVSGLARFDALSTLFVKMALEYPQSSESE